MNQTRPNRLKLLIIAGISVFAIIVLISLIAMSGIFHSNPYGPEQKINDFSRYFKNTPTPTRDMIYTGLYNVITLNISEGANRPETQATIRQNTANTTYNETTKIYDNNFIVDVTGINQSFKIWFEWSENENNTNLSGYQVSITCLNGADSLYGSTNCKDSSTSNPIQEIYNSHPILTYLPLDIAYYANTYSGYVHYTITYETIYTDSDDNPNIVLVITDYTGGNRNNAIAQLNKYNIDLRNYEIRYVDESASEIPSRAPSDDV